MDLHLTRLKEIHARKTCLLCLKEHDLSLEQCYVLKKGVIIGSDSRSLVLKDETFTLTAVL